MARPRPSPNAGPRPPETGTLIREFPDGFSQLLTMIAQWASDPEGCQRNHLVDPRQRIVLGVQPRILVRDVEKTHLAHRRFPTPTRQTVQILTDQSPGEGIFRGTPIQILLLNAGELRETIGQSNNPASKNRVDQMGRWTGLTGDPRCYLLIGCVNYSVASLASAIASISIIASGV